MATGMEHVPGVSCCLPEQPPPRQRTLSHKDNPSKPRQDVNHQTPRASQTDQSYHHRGNSVDNDVDMQASEADDTQRGG
jgi:hypothetical protein